MKYVVVVPFTYRPYFDAFMSSCKIPTENILTIDNTDPDRNIGCMASHNKGIEFMREKGADWLVVISPAIRFGENGGLDFIEILKQYSDHQIIHGGSANIKGELQHTIEGGGHNKVFGWHLVAFSKVILDLAGGWDENLSPYSLCDIDMTLRIRKVMPNVKWETYPCDVTDTTMSHSINLSGVKAAYAPRNSYFTRKWGREGGDWQNDGYEYPFNDPTRPVSYWPQAYEKDSIWRNEYASGEYKYED